MTGMGGIFIIFSYIYNFLTKQRTLANRISSCLKNIRSPGLVCRRHCPANQGLQFVAGGRSASAGSALAVDGCIGSIVGRRHQGSISVQWILPQKSSQNCRSGTTQNLAVFPACFFYF